MPSPPLVPVDSASSRSLVGVIALLTFLAALCAGIAELVAESSADWSSAISREVTIQIRPTPQRDMEAAVTQAVELARKAPGVAEVRAFSKGEAEQLLEPWLGRGLDLSDLPMPRLIVLKLADRSRPDMTELKTQLAEQVPSAILDDHGLWLSRLSTMASTVVGIAAALVVLVLVATGLAVAFATRGAMASNREVVDVLHFVGAKDGFIAREFRMRFLRLGLKGGLVGSVAALALIAAVGVASSPSRATAAGAQIEVLFGTFDMSWFGYVLVLSIALVVSGITGLVSEVAVRRYLRDA
jgi:cell division transport system permease protein